MAYKIQTKQSYDYKEHRNQIDWGEKLTVPSQAYTVKEILERVIQGRPVPSVDMESFNLVDDSENIGFEDVNPLLTSPDRLTTGDEIRLELQELGLKRKKSEDKKIAEEAEKQKNESKAKVIEDYKATEAKKSADKKSTT